MSSTFAVSASPNRPLLDLARRGWLWRLALVLIGSWAIALAARINVPMVPVPMSMQTFAVLLVAVLGGRTLGVQTVAAYLVQGAAGLPMFAGGAGLAYMAGPTGGYLVGFLAAAAVTGHLADLGWRRLVPLTLSVLAGHAVIFVFGMAWLAVLAGLAVAVTSGFLPFVPGLFAKTAMIVALVKALRF